MHLNKKKKKPIERLYAWDTTFLGKKNMFITPRSKLQEEWGLFMRYNFCLWKRNVFIEPTSKQEEEYIKDCQSAFSAIPSGSLLVDYTIIASLKNENETLVSSARLMMSLGQYSVIYGINYQLRVAFRW